MNCKDLQMQKWNPRYWERVEEIDAVMLMVPTARAPDMRGETFQLVLTPRLMAWPLTSFLVSLRLGYQSVTSPTWRFIPNSNSQGSSMFSPIYTTRDNCNILRKLNLYNTHRCLLLYLFNNTFLGLFYASPVPDTGSVARSKWLFWVFISENPVEVNNHTNNTNVNTVYTSITQDNGPCKVRAKPALTGSRVSSLRPGMWSDTAGAELAERRPWQEGVQQWPCQEGGEPAGGGVESVGWWSGTRACRRNLSS